MSLQAVLEQCAKISDETATSATGSGKAKNGHTPPALLSSKVVELYKENAVYIAEVVDASRNLLRHVVQGLVPRNGLKHAPARTYLRILSGAMFLLKVSPENLAYSIIQHSVSYVLHLFFFLTYLLKTATCLSTEQPC